ncbi:MAG: hypothetical protein ABSF90_19000 [Syntrophobacteraceae bacterium]|jgi:DNA-binding NarL/FixJ family response regulator
MSEDFHFLWIDDAPSMKQAAANLAAITDAEVGFHLSDDGLAPEIDKLMHEHVPDLVIVDHKLNWDLGASGTSLKATGATVAELIKDLYPQVPVVCVTKVDVDKEITYAQKSVYDYVIRADDLTRQSKVILSIAKGFRQINDKSPDGPEELLKLLDCPEVDRTRLIQVLPENITAFKPDGYASVLWRWIAEVLFARPGFLYDSLWAATLVGANETFFDKVKEKLRSARYSGIFANYVDQRWWVSRILETLYKTDSALKERDPRLLGRVYLEIPEQGYSECREICGEEIPDTVAYTDITNKKRIQVSLRHTQAHPHFQKRLFFEDIRVIEEK